MTDEQLDQMVRDADPSRPDVIADLDGAEQTLLEEIVSVSHDRRGMFRRTAGALVAAALLTGVLAASTVLRSDPEFGRVLAAVKHVDVPTWLAAVPATIVTPGRVDSAAAKILADVPLPPGFDVGALAAVGTNDPYQFGAQVTGRVGCAWIAEWIRANRAGDDAALRKASDALRSSHQRKVLHDMEDAGGWSEVFWETVDGVAAGNISNGYASAVGCD